MPVDEPKTIAQPNVNLIKSQQLSKLQLDAERVMHAVPDKPERHLRPRHQVDVAAGGEKPPGADSVTLT